MITRSAEAAQPKKPKANGGAPSIQTEFSPTEMLYLPNQPDGADSFISPEPELERLAALDPFQYEHQRATAAKRLNIPLSTLDRLCKALRKTKTDTGGQGRPLEFPEVERWHVEVVGSELLDEITELFHRFVICNPSTAHAATLWVAFSWLIESVRVAPIALITAPEKRCGKSVLLNTIAKLVPRPMPTSGITASALFRVIEMHKPTLLIDEVDVVLKDNEALRGVLNSGHTRDSATLIRSVGEDHSPRQFSTWGAKLIAGISADLLADTVTDRAIVLELRRKTKIESVERLRHADAMLFYNLKRKLARWTADNAAAVSDCTVNIPDELSDRAQDNWEPLLAIADAAGGHWPRTARETAVAISARNEEATGTAGTELLASVWRILETRDDPRIPMSELLTLLLQEPEGRWSQYDYGRSLTVHQLGRLLKKYGIKSKTIRFGANTEKGYDRHQFVEVVLRYLPHLPTNKENGLPDNPVTLVT